MRTFPKVFRTPVLLLMALLLVLRAFSLSASATQPPAMPEGPELAAAAWILIDPETGRELTARNPDERRSPASTTKILTALVALENAPLDTPMTASQTAIDSVGYDYVRAGILPGETLTLRTLLEMMLVTSANEAGYIIAENISPDHTLAGFNTLMNERAKQLGISDADLHFTNPCGVEEEGHYATARALARVAQEAMKNGTFREIVAMTGITAPDTNLRTSADWQIGHLTPTNELVSNPALYGSKHFKATGIKTGYTTPAGRCLVSSGVNPDGLSFIGVVLGAESPEVSFRESRRLLEFGFSNYVRQELKLSGEYYGRFDVLDAEDDTRITINTSGSLEWLMPADPALAAAITTEEALLPETFTAPITTGETLGELRVFVLSEQVGSVQLVAGNDVPKSRWADIRDRYLEFLANPLWMSILKTAAVVLVLLLLLRLVLRSISRRRNRRWYSRSRRNNHRITQFRK
jgi:D-alanyl-D-alanine carboxypeptidase